MAQYARPSSDIDDDFWEDTTGGNSDGDLFDEIDETVASDGDYIRIIYYFGECVMHLSDVTDPAIGTGHIMRCRAREATGGAYIRYRLYEGATLRASRSHFFATGFETDSYTLTTEEADSIGDYTDLRVRFYCNAESGAADVSWFEFEVPEYTPPTTRDCWITVVNP